MVGITTQSDQLERPILYDYWRSSASYRVRIALGLKGLSWEQRVVNLLAGEQQSASHLARNPQGLVPVLEIDGLRLTQSLAIIDYLDETRRSPPLLPKNPADRARVRGLAQIIAMEIHPVNNLGVLKHVATLTGQADQAKLAWMRHFMPQGLLAFESQLMRTGTGEYCHGDTPTLADICLLPQVYNARRWGIDLTPYPTLSRIAQLCEGLPAFSKAHPDLHNPMRQEKN